MTQIGGLTSLGLTSLGLRTPINRHNDRRFYSWIYQILISKLLSILLQENSKKRRRAFSLTVKPQVVYSQNENCMVCKRFVHGLTREFHHKDGNRVNNKISNYQMLCSNCHSKKTRQRF
jgi:HNH endonuclease